MTRKQPGSTITGTQGGDVSDIRHVPKTPARIVDFAPGSTWRVGDSYVTIQRQHSAHDIVVRYVATGQIATVTLGALVPVSPDSEARGAVGDCKPITEHSAAVWSRAMDEEAQIRALLTAGDLSPAARLKTAERLGISDRQLRRKLKRYESLHTAAALLPQPVGPAHGASQLHPDLEDLIRDQIEQALKFSPDAGVDDLLPVIVAEAKTRCLRPPGRSTVSRRLQKARLNTDLLPAAIGGELSYRRKAVRGAHGAEGPLHIVEMDHTVVDVHIVEPRNNTPIGRPVLTLMIDRATRVILGLLLSLEAPSRLSVGLCMHHGVMPKQSWLQSLGIPDACWPGFGLVHRLYTDNGQDFHALSLQRACQIYGIHIGFRPPGDPAAGGIIERAIGTFMTKARLLPGTSYSKLLGQTPRNAHRSGRFTLAELELYLARQVSQYHKTTHQGLGMAPLTAWERGWLVNGTMGAPRLPDSGDKFLLNFLPGELRTVTREGIDLFSLRYQSADLGPLVAPGRKRMVRFDPRNLARVFVEADDRHVVVGLAGTPVPAFSLWEWREVRAQQVTTGRTRDPERLAAEVLANRALIATKAKQAGPLRNARRQARQEAWQPAPTSTGNEPRERVIPKLDGPIVCRVED